MNINIYLEDQLGQDLAKCAQSTGQSRNSIVRDALKQWIQSYHNHQWSDDIMQFNGIRDFLTFESHRDELISSKEDPLA